MSRSRKRDRTGQITYWLCLLLYVIALSAFAIFALKAVWDFAERYEESMPEPVVEKYVAELNENLFDSGVADTIAAMPHPVQTDDECKAALLEVLNGEVTYSQITSDDNNANCYALLCNGSTFGKVYLVRDESKNAKFEVYGKELNLPFDLRPWLVSREEFDFTGLYTSVEVTIPESYSVQLNGHTLGDEYIVESGIEFDCLANYYRLSSSLPTKVTYRFDEIIGQLTPVIFDEDGNEYTIDTEQDDSQYIKPVEGAQVERLDSFCEEFIYPYSRYISGIMGKGYVNGYYNLQQNYVLAGSDLDSRLHQMFDGLEWAHTNSFSLDSYTFNKAINIGEGYYVCSITTETTSVTGGSGESHDTNNLDILVLDSGSEIRAVSLV